jgi:uncharacterized protein (TIGR03435 family)
MPSGRARFFFALGFLALLAFHQSQAGDEAAGENPAYDVASVRPTNSNAAILLGFYLYPSGRVTWGGQTVRDLLSYAFNLPPAQIMGGPPWINDKRFDIHALTPVSYQEQQSDLIVNPSKIQRLMLQSLLRERFKVKVHHDFQTRLVFILKVKKHSSSLSPTAHPNGDPHGGILTQVDGAVTGQAFGDNITMAFLAEDISERLAYPVIDETGLRGGFDFKLPEVESDNHDMLRGVDLVLDRLGLMLEKGKRPVDSLAVERVDVPTPD